MVEVILIKIISGAKRLCVSVYLKEVVIVKKRCVVLKFSLLGLFYLILPLLFQFCYTLKAQELIRHRRGLQFFGCVMVGSLDLPFLNSKEGLLLNISLIRRHSVLFQYFPYIILLYNIFL